MAEICLGNEVARARSLLSWREVGDTNGDVLRRKEKAAYLLLDQEVERNSKFCSEVAFSILEEHWERRIGEMLMDLGYLAQDRCWRSWGGLFILPLHYIVKKGEVRGAESTAGVRRAGRREGSTSDLK